MSMFETPARGGPRPSPHSRVSATVSRSASQSASSSKTKTTEMFSPPNGMSVKSALIMIFKHYCSPWKSSISTDTKDIMLDSQRFVKMCKEAPGLETKRMTRHDFDIVFTKCQHMAFRRLDFEHFLDSLLELSARRYPSYDPITAFASLLVHHIFGLFDQPPVRDNKLLDSVKEELTN